jgi:CRISPR-associated endonuclease/helicase Cas3
VASGVTLAIALDWVRRVYQSGLTDKERKRFDAAKAALRPVVQALRPLHRHGEGESAFRGFFQRVEVLPRGLYNEYDKHLQN